MHRSLDVGPRAVAASVGYTRQGDIPGRQKCCPRQLDTAPSDGERDSMHSGATLDGTRIAKQRPNWYWSRPLTPTCNDTHRGHGASAVYPTVGRHPTPLRTQSQPPQILQNRDHCRALAGKRAAVPGERLVSLRRRCA
jgi:hypothetical protein